MSSSPICGSRQSDETAHSISTWLREMGITNPCRCTIFDLLQIDKEEINLGIIKRAIQDAKQRQEAKRLLCPSGESAGLTRGQLNGLTDDFMKPNDRLRKEQFVHQSHPLLSDEEVREQAEDFVDGERDLLPEMLRASLLSLLQTAIPQPERVSIEDDLPWPEAPDPFPITRESLRHTILRER